MERSSKWVATQLDELTEKCRASGMNVTPQRMAVYRALLETESHPTPELLYNAVRAQMPSISLATIYKALEALVDLGLVQAVPVLGESRRYDANMDPHHHLVCTQCGRMADYLEESLEALRPAGRVGGFRTRSVSVQFMGLCADCAGKAADRGGTSNVRKARAPKRTRAIQGGV